MTEVIRNDREYIANTYARFNVEIERGKGSLVYAPDGTEYIDMGAGIGVTAFGIADEEWKRAVIGQLNAVQHTSNLYYTKPCTELAKALCLRTGMKKVFFGNSGAEANECAIKVARKYAAERKGPKCYTIVTLKNSFHGRTLTTLAATGQEVFHEKFQPLTPGFVHAEPDDTQGLEALVASCDPAAIMIETVQGEGGVKALDAEFVKAVERICRERDLLFIVDEVQTGNGRSGALYSYMNFGVQPDLVTTAKGLGGGLPIGACLIGERAENVLGCGDHGSTFGANPVCCAGALNILNRIDDRLLAEVREKSAYLFRELRGAKGAVSVSGMGLMIGILPEKPAREVVQRCIDRGVLCLTAKDRVRLLPALNIPFETLQRAVAAIKDALAE